MIQAARRRLLAVEAIAILSVCIVQIACTSHPSDTGRDHTLNYDSLYAGYGLKGCFVLLHEGDSIPYVYQPIMANHRYSPASTFKIPNALIALETGVLADTSERMEWDGVVRRVESWNHDHTLNTAFRNSVVWYFQEVARRIGPERMQHWIDTLDYGNRNISGGIDRFWLDGGLRISPVQQVYFIQQLYLRSLPCSQLSQQQVLELMEQERTTDYVLGGKTGWSMGDSLMTGWFVGYLQTLHDTVYFANCIQTADTAHLEFGPARKEISIQILKDQGLILSE